MSADQASIGADPAAASLANWRSSPWSRWAFRNIPRILPVGEIAAGAPRALVETPSAFEGFRLDRPDGTTLDLEGFLTATATDGMVVLRDGRILFEIYRNGLDPETPHIVMSATKSLSGLVAGALAGAGRLDVEAPVSDYVPEVAFSGWQDATVRDLLDMRTGVILDPEGQRAYQAAANWDPYAPDEAGANLHDFLTTLPPAAGPHGGPFRYTSPNTDLLGWVMERAGGRPFVELASDLLWRPAGAERSALITLDRAGAPRCTGGLCATVRDFARVGWLVVDGGVRDGAQVFPAGWIEDLLTAGDRQAWADGEWGEAFRHVSREMSYRAGWYVTHDRPGSMFAMGIHGQNLFVDRESRVVVAKVSSQNSPIDAKAIALAHAALPLLRDLALRA
ncbi:serine hydrolase domain-containing protein [Caulobacter mirabilis]|uniref:6-aminohexanoate hydrolase n=1 Tax=Caulobacter mirabilis TaxID=69666 RepID=A0A2D2AUZ7_9CAUL|nr:serine hydrolase [Caulobacter mirabilis]ATQ41803.1 6-aminohexanoate hydrolase [Caulobacter mirabilis]